MADQRDDFGTVLGADATFKGEFTFDSAAKVLGKIEGSITARGKVHIADGAECRATINAKEVAVEGLIEGNVEADGRLDLRPTACVTGDIVAQTMSMADGASIDGHCRIGVNGKAGSSSSSGSGKQTTTTETKPQGQTGQQGQGQQAQRKETSKS